MQSIYHLPYNAGKAPAIFHVWLQETQAMVVGLSLLKSETYAFVCYCLLLLLLASASHPRLFMHHLSVRQREPALTHARRTPTQHSWGLTPADVVLPGRPVIAFVLRESVPLSSRETETLRRRAHRCLPWHRNVVERLTFRMSDIADAEPSGWRLRHRGEKGPAVQKKPPKKQSEWESETTALNYTPVVPWHDPRHQG